MFWHDPAQHDYNITLRGTRFTVHETVKGVAVRSSMGLLKIIKATVLQLPVLPAEKTIEVDMISRAFLSSGTNMPIYPATQCNNHDSGAIQAKDFC